MHYGLITDHSRKAKSARSLYESIKNKENAISKDDEMIFEFPVQGGFKVASEEKQRVLKLRLHDEHMSPYFKTDMNLFHLLMIDEKTEMFVYLTEEGILLVFEGLQNSPQPFGTSGHDMR